MAPMTGKVNHDWKVDLDTADFTDKSILIVGGTSGLGQAIAKESVARGCKKVTVVGRSFKDDPEKIDFIKADLSVMKEAQNIGETVPAADVVVFTTGIVPHNEKQESSEGIELDMATSYLSRLVILKFLTPRLSKGSRVFIMGFPGCNQANFNVDDLNADDKYEGGFGFVHMNTVAGNEALVLDYAEKSNGDITYFGLNPGIIKTGIRDNMYTGWKVVLKPFLETSIGIFSKSPQGYAKKITPLMFAQGFEEHNGSMFNPSSQPTYKSNHFEKDKDLVNKFMEKSKELVISKSGVEV